MGDRNVELGILLVYGEHPHSLIKRSSYGLGSLHLEPFCGQEGVQQFGIYCWSQVSYLFGKQKNSAEETWSIDVVDSFQSAFVHHLLNFCVMI